MQIIIKEPTKEALEKNGWELILVDMYDIVTYSKKIKDKETHFVIHNNEKSDQITDVYYDDVPTPDDLIAIGNELKKLEVTQ